MKDIYAEYIKERENLNVIKTDKGFISYRIEFPYCLINDYFVLKEFRRSGHGYFLANQVFEICRQAGVITVFCQSDDNANGVELSKFTIEHFGFEKVSEIDTISKYKMEVSTWEAL